MKIDKLSITDPLKTADVNDRFSKVEKALSLLPVYFGNGSPEGVVFARIGSIYMRFDGSTASSFYIKESGNNTPYGWVAGGAGPPGPAGPTGPTGPAGLIGSSGPATQPETAEDGILTMPGPQGPVGATGSVGAIGPAIYLASDPGEDAVPFPGPIGNTGFTGPAGPAVYLTADPGEDGVPTIPGPLGPAGPTGSVGPLGPAIFLAAEQGDDGGFGPPGPVSILDRDYLAQTYTPTVTLVGGAGNTVPVYSSKSGRYVRIGRLCFVDILLTGDGGAEGAGTGVFTVTLPLTSSPSTLGAFTPAGYVRNGGTENLAFIQIGTSATTFNVQRLATISTLPNVTGADQNNTTRTVRLAFFYEV